jgi:hypothetical protein
MSRAPKNEVLQRLSVSVDKSWKGGTYVVVSVKPYAQEAMQALNYMIPECTHEFGKEAAKLWFTTPGLLAYQHVKWDPNKRSTTSQQDRETRAMVAEDLFGIGTSWKIEAPIMRGIARRPTEIAANNRANNHPASQTAAASVAAATAAIHSRTIDSDVRSFGSIYGRTPDDESIATNRTAAKDNATDVEEPTNVVIQFDPNLPTDANQQKEQDNDAHSMAASSAGFTRDSTRSKLREQTKVNELLRQQMLDLNALLNPSDDASILSNMTEKTTKSTRQQLAEALASLQLMQQNQASKDTTQPKAPAHDKPTDTEPGGVGHQI